MIARALDHAIYASTPMSWTDAAVLGVLTVTLAVPAVAGLYLVKSALGINLMDGPSPLHDLLYHYVA